MAGNNPRDFRLPGNDPFAQQRQLALQRQMFARALASGEARVLDRFAQGINIGDMILYQPDVDYVMDVVDLVAAMDPRAPLGAVTLTISVTAKVTIPANTPLPKMIRVGRKSADGVATEIITPVVGAEAPTQAEAPGETASETPPVITGDTQDDSDGRD